ncbi:hypothetical protein [Streptomyces sp. NPDC002564]|uniref:hypothetical protein n=1 Tax=Streptomyces sp. NPDC002564 TaxID=3364649 RepID=UPI0036A188CE
MVSPVPARRPLFVTEWQHLFVVLINADFEDLIDLERLDMALEIGRLTGKHVAVDASRIPFMSAEVLTTLLRHRQRTGHLPWLVGPLSPPTTRRLEISGTLRLFEIFPTLLEATAHSRGE